MKKTWIIAVLTLALAASVSATGLSVAGVALDVGRMPDSSNSDRVAWFNDAPP